MNMQVGTVGTDQYTKPVTRRHPATRISRGGIAEINPADIIYGEYTRAHSDYSNYIDLVYLDDDILRTFTGSVNPNDPVIQELKILLKNEEAFYLIPIKEVPLGFAFKRTDIVDIKVSSLIEGNDDHEPSCIWTINFKDGNKRTLENAYQSYFSYGNTIRPKNMTNVSLLEKVFADDKKE